MVGHGYRRFAFLGDPDTAASEAGLRIPEDLAVTGWVDVMAAAFAGLTTVRQPMRELGATAARWLHDRITERTSDPTRRPARSGARSSPRSSSSVPAAATAMRR